MNGVKLVPLTQWICDSCWGKVETPDEGKLEWVVNQNDKKFGYRIVHSRCKYHRQELRKKDIADHLPLGELTGSKGLVRLLDFLESKDYLDRAEIKEVIRRIHIEYYEEARAYWPRALHDGVIQEVNKRSNYFPEFSLKIIQKYNDHEDEKLHLTEASMSL